MKAKLLLSAGLLLIATSASAQFVQQPTKPTVNTVQESKYSQMYFQYNPQTLNGENDDESGFNGFLVGFKFGNSLSSSDPIYLEYGFNFQYTSYSKHDDDVNMGTLAVPLNLTYRWAIPNSTITLAPYAGLTVKGHLWAKEEYKDSYYGKKQKTDWFDEDDMGDDNTANRLQLGWQIGVNVGFKKFHVGIGYGKDLTDFFEDEKFSATNITLGFDI